MGPIPLALSVLAVFGLVITAIYLLKAIRLGFQGPLNPQWAQLTDAQTTFAKFLMCCYWHY